MAALSTWPESMTVGAALPTCRRLWPIGQREALAILLAHEPDLADDFTTDTRISLQLSGHSHGGQVRLPGIRTNRGLGLIAPIRINCPPEVTEITLVGV